MPRLTRWCVKTAMLYLLGALLLGVFLQGPAAHTPILVAARPTYLHLLVVGWLTQLIFGIAFWLFPRYSSDRPRGHESLGWAAYGFLNVGLVLRVLGEPGAALRVLPGWLLVLSAVAQLIAGWTFVFAIWPRVKER
jgi:hypothetical protein